MNVEELREFCISLPYVEECFPFDDMTLVFKIRGRMFAYVPLENTDACINLKCDPERAIELREEYAGITPGYHMSKKHWNTVFAQADVPDELLKELIRHSYNEVVKKLPKSIRESLGK